MKYSSKDPPDEEQTLVQEDAPQPAPAGQSFFDILVDIARGHLHEIQGNPSKSSSSRRIILKIPLMLVLTFVYGQAKIIVYAVGRSFVGLAARYPVMHHS